MEVSAEYIPSGHLVYAAANTLRAVRFDLERLQVLSDPVTVVDDVSMNQRRGTIRVLPDGHTCLRSVAPADGEVARVGRSQGAGSADPRSGSRVH